MFLWIIWKPACKGNKNNNKISPIAEILTSNSAIKVFTREKNFITWDSWPWIFSWSSKSLKNKMNADIKTVQSIYDSFCFRITSQIMVGTRVVTLAWLSVTRDTYLRLLTLKIKWSWSSTVEPGKNGLPVAISKNIHPTPLHIKEMMKFGGGRSFLIKAS